MNNKAIDTRKIEEAIKLFLEALGEDSEREGLIETPQRVARAASELFSGYREDPRAHLRKQFFEPSAQDPVIVSNILFNSMCEHHILPFTGRAHLAYLPQEGRICGLSKLARCVQGYAHRLQVQERMSAQIADALMAELKPLGALVVLEAEHSCMSLRGIKAHGSLTTTVAARGCYLDPVKKDELLSLMGLHALKR